MIDKREHIINTAVDLFAVKGFEGTSVRDIASAADVNVAMINYYFGSKEKLFESIVEQRAAYTRGLLDEIEKNKSLSDIEKIDAIIEAYVNKVFASRKFHRLIHQEMMLSEREELQTAIVNMIYPNSVIIKGILDSGIKKGEFKKVDTVLSLSTMIGTMNHVLLSRKMCNKLLNKDDNYIPYDDAKFKKRVIDHIQNVMHDHLLMKNNHSKTK